MKLISKYGLACYFLQKAYMRINFDQTNKA